MRYQRPKQLANLNGRNALPRKNAFSDAPPMPGAPQGTGTCVVFRQMQRAASMRTGVVAHRQLPVTQMKNRVPRCVDRRIRGAAA